MKTEEIFEKISGLNMPGLILRVTGERGNKRPILSDLREIVGGPKLYFF